MKGNGGRQPEKPAKRPYRISLPGFVRDEEVGLGDVIKHATASIGIKPCGQCGDRAAKLNSWVRFSRYGRRV